MNDLINREDVIKSLQSMMQDCFPEAEEELDAVVTTVREIPSAEPKRKIIYCKDCKFYTPMNRILKTGICSMTMHHLGDDGFCSTAEKRGE